MPDYPKRSERVLWSGVTTIEYAVRRSGKMEAKDWFEAQDDGTKAKFDHLFRKAANGQRIHNKQHFRKLSKNIWEFKRDEHRLLTFQHNGGWFLTHHYPKGKKKCPPEQIERAEQIRVECLEILKKEAEGEDNGNT
jgi:hypothetical protein